MITIFERTMTERSVRAQELIAEQLKRIADLLEEKTKEGGEQDDKK